MSDRPSPLDDLLALMPYAVTLDVRLEKAEPGHVRDTLEWSPELCTAGGVLHGGAVMALADSIGAVCAFLNLPVGARPPRSSGKTNFFRAVTSGTPLADARPLHTGRSFIVVQTELSDVSGKAVGMTVQTQAVSVR